MLLKRLILSALIVWLFSGCSMGQVPSIGNRLRENQKISDVDVVIVASDLENRWGSRSTKAQVADIGGSVVLSGLSTGAAIANASQASGPTTGLIVAVGSFIGQALGIVDPPGRINALNEGTALVRAAVGEYAIAITRAGHTTVPNNKLTVQGGELLQKINSAVGTVDRLIEGRRPEAEDTERLKQKFSTDRATESPPEHTIK